MKYIRIATPGIQCLYYSFLELLKNKKFTNFLEIGIGWGDLSLLLLKKGFSGSGMDLSDDAIKSASVTLSDYVKINRYSLIKKDILEDSNNLEQVDFVFSTMVLEHIYDDIAFVRAMAARVRKGGLVINAVPGRKDRWAIQDDTVGHLRHYDRQEICQKMSDSGLINVNALSIGVPVTNLFYNLSNWVFGQSNEMNKLNLSTEQQTIKSGVREIKFQTHFPSPFRFIFNPVALFPFFIVQKLFYKTDLGYWLLSFGEKR